jgi:hypothetical protein
MGSFDSFAYNAKHFIEAIVEVFISIDGEAQALL